MVRLVPMTEAEYHDFMEISMRDQAQGQVQAGEWHAEEADELIKGLRKRFLPDDLATPNHFFYTIEEQFSGTKVGGLWHMVTEQDEKRQVFVVDIQVLEAHRRRGYGSQAFAIMEGQARQMGVTTVSLHVLKYNLSARAMYGKLGYAGTGGMMSKELRVAAE